MKGDKFTVRLADTPTSAGYLWFPEPNDNYRLLKENGFTVNGGDNLDLKDFAIGSPVTSVFEIEALTDEPFEVTFNLKRPWLIDEEPMRSKTFKFNE